MTDLVDARPVVTHLTRLREVAGWRPIAEAAGLPLSTVRSIGTRRPRRVRADHAEKLLAAAVTPAPGARIDGTVTWAKVDWLLSNGWTLRGLAWETDRNTFHLRRDFNHRGLVRWDFAQLIDRLHREARTRLPAAHLSIYPLDALLRADGIGGTERDPAGTVRARAERIGVDPAQYHRWLNGAPVSDQVADRIAVTAGFHPVLVWPDFYDFDQEASCG